MFGTDYDHQPTQDGIRPPRHLAKDKADKKAKQTVEYEDVKKQEIPDAFKEGSNNIHLNLTDANAKICRVKFKVNFEPEGQQPENSEKKKEEQLKIEKKLLSGDFDKELAAKKIDGIYEMVETKEVGEDTWRNTDMWSFKPSKQFQYDMDSEKARAAASATGASSMSMVPSPVPVPVVPAATTMVPTSEEVSITVAQEPVLDIQADSSETPAITSTRLSLTDLDAGKGTPTSV